MTQARKYINNSCSFWWIVMWSTFPEWTFPGPQKPLPCASQATRSSLGEGGGVLPCWIEEICGIVALTPSTHCSQWPRAWPRLCRVDLRCGNSSGHLCKRVGWGPMCLCGWAIGRGPGSTPPPPAPPPHCPPRKDVLFPYNKKDLWNKNCSFFPFYFLEVKKNPYNWKDVRF